MKAIFIRIYPSILLFVIIVAGWQLSVDLFDVPNWLVPAPTEILLEFGHSSKLLWNHTLATVNLTMIGLVVGTIFGIAVGCMLHLLPLAQRAVAPLLVLSQNVPVVVLANLLVIWLGYGLLPKVLLLITVVFFPITIAMMNGLAQVDKSYLTYFTMIGASRWQRFRHVEWPFSLSHFFGGLKIAASYCVIGSIYAETIGSSQGIGVFIRLSMSGFYTARVFVGVIILITLSIALFVIIASIEKYTMRWRGER